MPSYVVCDHMIVRVSGRDYVAGQQVPVPEADVPTFLREGYIRPVDGAEPPPAPMVAAVSEATHEAVKAERDALAARVAELEAMLTEPGPAPSSAPAPARKPRGA